MITEKPPYTDMIVGTAPQKVCHAGFKNDMRVIIIIIVISNLLLEDKTLLLWPSQLPSIKLYVFMISILIIYNVK